MGPPPIETAEGWLVIYHGVRTTMSGSIYRVGLALLDLENPVIVRRRSEEWVLSPQAPYERVGDVPNVVFPCGVVVDPATDELRLYYGAADTSVGVATSSVAKLLDHLRRNGAAYE
jgi:beta-1,4-mannooligosaccharide/beta-1,4-mannosyl-N-acetylglucosamine phosphorylase